MTEQIDRVRTPGPRPLLAVCVAMAVALWAWPAAAQRGGGWGGMEQLLEPAITSGQIDRFAAILAMSDDQRSDAQEMLDGYLMEHEAMASELRRTWEAARQEMRETRDRSIWRDVMAVMEDHRERMRDNEQIFMDDLQLILTEDQLTAWPSVERMRRRIAAQRGRTLVSGENVDLVAVIDEAEVSDESRQALEPVLAQYEIEFDRALVRRDDVYEQAFAEARQLFASGDTEALEKLFDDARDAGTRLRDVSRRYARQVEPLLAEGERERFESMVRERSYPQVYRQTFGQRAFTTANGFEDLTDEQRQQLSDLRTSYTRDLESLNRRWVDAIDENDQRRSVRALFRRGAPGGDEGRELREERRELDLQTLEQLRGILTEDQAERLPEPPADRGDWRDRGGRRDGRGGAPGPRRAEI